MATSNNLIKAIKDYLQNQSNRDTLVLLIMFVSGLSLLIVGSANFHINDWIVKSQYSPTLVILGTSITLFTLYFFTQKNKQNRASNNDLIVKKANIKVSRWEVKRELSGKKVLTVFGSYKSKPTDSQKLICVNRIEDDMYQLFPKISFCSFDEVTKTWKMNVEVDGRGFKNLRLVLANGSTAKNLVSYIESVRNHLRTIQLKNMIPFVGTLGDDFILIEEIPIYLESWDWQMGVCQKSA